MATKKRELHICTSATRVISKVLEQKSENNECLLDMIRTYLLGYTVPISELSQWVYTTLTWPALL